MFKYERYVGYSLLICLLLVIIFLIASLKQTPRIDMLDDMKKASSEAVEELANQQRAAASYFEAMNAWSREDRNAALAQARDVQGRTALPFESSMQLLEAQKRTFGEIDQAATDQFAAYWRMHGFEQTPNLIRWMGASGIKTPERQGQIMRMISTISNQPNMPTPREIIAVLSSQGSRFRNLGWTPEETLINLTKIMVPGEGIVVVCRVLDALEGFTEEKAYELGMPAQKANQKK